MSRIAEFFPKEIPRHRLIVQTLCATAVMTMIDFTFAISAAAFIFSGDLAPFIPAGVGLLLVASVIPSFVIAFWGTNPSSICAARAGLTPIFAGLAAGIGATLAAAGNVDSILPTIIAAIGASTILTGLFLFLLGHFKLGKLIRYIPYPVMGGFFAGLGYLLSTGGIAVMADAPVNLLDPGPLMEKDALILWLPGTLFGIALYLAKRFKDHWLMVPAFFVGGTAFFYGCLKVTGLDPAAAAEMGLLIPVESAGAFWPPIDLSDFDRIDAGIISGQIPTLAVIAIIGAISLLLDASGIEILTRKDVDLNRDLKVTGAANLLAGGAGGCVGVHAAADTAFAVNLGATSRLAPLFYAVFCLFALFFGTRILGYVPVPVLGGLLVFLGCTFLVQWLFDEFKRLPLGDYGVVVVIMLSMATLGLLQGIGVGVVLVILFFAYNYSKVSVIKFEISGSRLETNIDRPREHVEILDRYGDRIHVYMLEGYLFFGSANKLLETIRERVRDRTRSPVDYLILDFRMVTQIDSSAAFGFEKLKVLAENEGFALVLTQLSPEVEAMLDTIDFFRKRQATLTLAFPNLPQGGAWCQAQLLNGAGASPIEELDLEELLAPAISNSKARRQACEFFERIELPAHQELFRQGDPGDSLYLIGAGNVAVTAEEGSGRIKRLRTLTVGSVIGEMALYTAERRSATVATESESVLYRLSSANWKELSDRHPQLAAELHAFIVRLLSDRLARTNARLLQALS